MTEDRIGFLFKAASILSPANNNNTLEKLKSYYRMRCKEISKGYGLPQKQFSERTMCTHCCMEWKKGTAIKVKSIKLSRRQRKRIKSQKKFSNQLSKEYLFHSNEIEQTCSFCKHNIKTVALKPNKPMAIKSELPTSKLSAVPLKTDKNLIIKSKQGIDVYRSAEQVFSLRNNTNTLRNKIKEPKIIKNNKRKKDKFAGLCQKAVLMSAQLKKQTQQIELTKQNKLNLFLKPST